MRKIYIGKDYDGEILGVLLADSQEKAEIFWMGQNLGVCSTEEVDPSDTMIGIHGVVNLISTTEFQKSDIDHKSYDWTFRKINKR